MSRRFTCVDLFSGAGGLSRGFYDAGYNIVLGVDFDDAALETFKENHGSAETMKLDLFDHNNISIIVDYIVKKKYKFGCTYWRTSLSRLFYCRSKRCK